MAKTAGTPPTPKNYPAPALRLPRHLGENLGENLLTFRSFGASLYFPMINKARVFVVDDEQIIADTFAMILNRSGFDAVALYNGPDAIALCRRKIVRCLTHGRNDGTNKRNPDSNCYSRDLPDL
jgi:PleD family two-component response regulator